MQTHPTAGTSPATRTRWLALGLLATTQFVLILDAAIVGVALPSIAADLHFGRDDLSWVANAYTLLFGGFLLLGGRLADFLGRRRLFVGGLTLFTVASLTAALAQSGIVLVGARGLQGFAAALVSPAALSLVMILFPDGKERNRALGVWGAVAGSGAAAGLVLGGLLTDWLGWESVFFVNVPIGIAMVALAFRLLPPADSTEGGRNFDLAGAVSVTAGLALLVYVLVDANEAGWTSAQTFGLGALSLLLLATFVLIESRAPRPLVPLRTFRAPLVRGANTAAVLMTMAIFPTFFFITLYTQQVLGYSPIRSGFAQLPFALTVIVVASVAPVVMARIGVKATLVTGLTIVAVGLAWFTQISPSGSFLADLLGPAVVTATGGGLAFVSVTVAATSGAVEQEAGLASGLINTSQQIGGALGLGALISIATARTNDLIAGGERVAGVAITEGFQVGMFVGVGITALAVIAALLLIPSSRRDRGRVVATHPDPVVAGGYD